MLFRSIYTRFTINHTISRRLSALFTFVSAMVLLSACAATPGRQFSETNLEATREYSTPNHGIHLPVSIDDTIPVADILYLDEDVTAMLDKSVMSVSAPRRRLDAIFKILSKKVRWDTESDRYATKTAMETYRTGTGNCLSFANLFIAMARYAGLEAGYQEVSTGLNWNREGGVLFVSRHISATVTVDALYNSNVELVFTDDNEVMIQAGNNNSNSTLSAAIESLSTIKQENVEVKPISDYRAFAQFYNNIASMHLAEGDPELAFKYFFKSIETDPSLEFVWSNLGVAYSRNLQWAASEAAYFKALSIARDTNDVAVLSIMNNMVKLYERSGNEEKAAFYRTEVANLREMNPYYHYLAGQSAYSGASYETSVKYFKEAIKRKGDDDLFYYSLAMAYLKLGDIRKAEKNIGKAKHYAWDNQTKAYYAKILDKISEIAVN